MDKASRARGPVIVVIGSVLVIATLVVAILLWRHEAPNRRRSLELMRSEGEAREAPPSEGRSPLNDAGAYGAPP